MVLEYILRKIKNTKPYQDYIIRNLKKDPRYIFQVKDPSKKFLFRLIDINPGYLIRFIHVATPEHVKHAIYRDGKMIRFFPDLPDIGDDLKIAVIELDYTNVIYMRNLSHNVMKAAIMANPYAVNFIQEKIPDELFVIAITKDPDVIKFMENPSEEMKNYAKALGGDTSFLD